MPEATEGARPLYLDPSQPLSARVEDLVSRMTLEEKVSQMVHPAAAIPRLGVPEYNWWNECLHGVGRAGIATVFPQAIGLAATWNVELIRRASVAISDEARAKHHQFARQGIRDIYTGLTFWSPNINIFRDPRWGRGQETYGEDPYLTARMGVTFVQGLQGDHPRYLKLVATPKHFAAHSGPEPPRHGFDAQVGERDLRETYLPAFKACVVEGKAWSVMGAYNRLNGEPCCASKRLLCDILRREWGFPGYVVSDCGAIDDIWRHHRVAASPEEAAALAVKNGCDLNCGETYQHLVSAARQGLITEEEITAAVRRLFEARFRLGMFDPPEMVPYAQIPYEVNDCEEHRALAREAARQSIVLLKNDGLLPLARDLRCVAVVGPNADDHDVLLGNYNGTPSRDVTALDGIRALLGDRAEVRHARGCDWSGDSREGFAEALEAARGADVVIAVMGLHPRLEGEEGDAEAAEAGGDRVHIGLPGVQEELLRALHATGVPVVLVVMSGSALALTWADAHLPAIIAAWYPGEEGGAAIAETLFGDCNPGGRLPVTWYRSLDQLPPFGDYRMQGRTYRYFRQEALYPFGYGLSYTRFQYRDLRLSAVEVRPGEQVEATVEVENVGDRAGDEVVQAYLTDEQASVPVPLRQLVGFQRVSLAPGEKRRVRFAIAPEQMSLITDDGARMIEPGSFVLHVGGGQPGARGVAAGANALSARFAVVGAPLALPSL